MNESSFFQTYMFDYSSAKWTQLASLKTGRQLPGCGLAQKPDGFSQLVVAGGTQGRSFLPSVEIYDLVDNKWR